MNKLLIHQLRIEVFLREHIEKLGAEDFYTLLFERIEHIEKNPNTEAIYPRSRITTKGINHDSTDASQ